MYKSGEKNIFFEIRQRIEDGKQATYAFDVGKDRYIRTFSPGERAIILGGGHVAQPLCSYMVSLGFGVTVVDDRPSFVSSDRFPNASKLVCDAFGSALKNLKLTERDYVVIVTRGHRWDYECLKVILSNQIFPKYVGMMGSKRRVRALLERLEAEGYDSTLLERLCTPIGLDIGSQMIQEIAISIVAQMIMYRRGKEQGMMNQVRLGQSIKLTDSANTTDTAIKEYGGCPWGKTTNLIREDVDFDFLDFVCDTTLPKALMIVCETKGSTPVKSGAMMAVDKNYKMAGTIGGGCGEATALKEAYSLIGTGTSHMISVDMTNETAEEEGMVCGGTMCVWISDFSAETEIKMERCDRLG